MPSDLKPGSSERNSYPSEAPPGLSDANISPSDIQPYQSLLRPGAYEIQSIAFEARSMTSVQHSIWSDKPIIPADRGFGAFAGNSNASKALTSAPDTNSDAPEADYSACKGVTI